MDGWGAVVVEHVDVEARVAEDGSDFCTLIEAEDVMLVGASISAIGLDGEDGDIAIQSTPVRGFVGDHSEAPRVVAVELARRTARSGPTGAGHIEEETAARKLACRLGPARGTLDG